MNVVVIGAGVGGMSAALRLAKAGHTVTVLEQGERIGGKLNVWEPDVPGAGKFRFDTGPHVLTMPFAIRELFDDLGERMEDYLDLVRMDPICRYHFPDGATFDAPANPEEAARRIAETFPGDEAGFRELLAYSHRVYDVTVDTFLRQDFGSAVRGIPTPEQWKQLFQFLGLQPWKTIHDLSERYFKHPRLKQIFDLYAFYNGSSPYKASAIFAIIAWIQWGDGTYYLRGGLRTYADALAKLADKFGVQVCLNTMVRKIVREGNRVVSVAAKVPKIANKQGKDPVHFPCDVVVCNIDPTSASILFDLPEHQPNLNHFQHDKNLSTSAFVMLLGVKGTVAQDFPHLSHFNSFLPDNPRAEFDAIFKKGIPANDPVIGVTCQSVTEANCAPPGHTNLFVMTSPPAYCIWQWTDEETASYRERVLTLLETRCLMPNLRERIVCEQVWTPRTFEERYGAWRGSLYGVSSNGWRSAFLRPPNRSRTVKGLYFVGGGTHPGGGLPLVTLSGKIVAEAVQEDLR